MGVHRTCGETNKLKKNNHPKNIAAVVRSQEETQDSTVVHNDPEFTPSACVVLTSAEYDAYAPCAVQFHIDGGQLGFVWLPARTPHRGASYV